MIKPVQTNRKRIWLRLDLHLFLLSCILFVLFPEIDLRVSELFYDSNQGFYLKSSPLVMLVYNVFANIHFFILGILLILIYQDRIAILRKVSLPSALQLPKTKLKFLLVLLLVGPGILVNIALKDNSTGRPRPAQIEEFGGTNQFSKPFEITNQCHHNCSFVSGHASVGFYLMAFAWIFHARPWLLGGILLGGLVGLGRVIQGGHFLSDVLFCFWVMYLTTRLVAEFYKLRLDTPEPASA
ncbi:Na(+)-translocating NADH:ubiquinone oxidoreductase subunit F [Oleiphilus messinensis]|uniref:Na(+)-translocating NADH:ubiquinone oxidoreductase subunit F n=1 Tax=Oleiphilus messinensis TaxID=141451 RepID=A0A1Y0IBP6_9GAMM|nr:phosphatase PAP2 family protein [Oleiphilus messinensis]ARU57901.1 Na(+)-translocating NADH:ubiquinone oxidoreductase subunit F [Oleiphilus messinensis]